MDRDGNGQLDTAEFRDAMNKLGMQHLTGATVSTILSAMDIHGPISLDDFLQIVEVHSSAPTSVVASRKLPDALMALSLSDPAKT